MKHDLYTRFYLWLSAHRPLAFSLTAVAVLICLWISSRINLEEDITVMRRKLAGPEGMVLKDVVSADPIGMTELVANKVLPLQAGFGAAQIEDGRILSSDGHHVLMLAEPNFPSSNSKQSEGLVRDLLRHAQAVEQKFPGVHVAITGGHRM